MKRRATAVAHGAATIVNAITLGRGAAFGVDLWTKAEVELTNKAGIIKAEITSDPKECPLLVEKTSTRVLERFGLEKSFGVQITTQSNIPIARGLKSSSTAANATALATVAALDKQLDDLEIIKIGVEAAFDAKVTLTGAFDDACASYFGGAVITDNLNRQILKQIPLPQDVVVLFYVPPQKAYTINSDVSRLKTVKSLVETALEKAIDGKLWDALTLNGLVYSVASNQNPAIAIDALAAGAVAAGLCGKGPAVTAITPKDSIKKVKAAWQNYEGEIIQAYPNSKKAEVL
ncbi:shikimate kinase [Candidatus Bathycorpusculum sp.]|uniref:shikimate kinase n=1 Tax=Candidatus Bathycorpusculum sp. TaxID=2994959 RepID=UPI002818C7EB|nr:shikimate kinase [Candidatus Termitimicrobium sp.]MCL2432275.1 shikimate kinase [Candidatus Termitimicrobium sp.]